MANFKHHTSCDRCGSSDALAVYDDESVYCWSCGYATLSEDMKNEYKKNKPKSYNKGARMKPQETEVRTKELKPLIDKETAQEVKNNTSAKGSLYRGIKDEVLQYFGVRTEYSESNESGESEEVQAVYYPVTYEGKLSGYKVRKHPKTFSSIGRTGVECDLFGQFRYEQGGKVCLLVGGEHDQLAAYQMIREYQVSKGNGHYEPPAVVSPTIGESGCTKQIQKNYSFFDKFEKIIVAFDNDDAGEKATEKIMSALPKNKVFVMQMRFKDPNKYLLEGESQKFIRDYYEAKKYVPAGIVGSNELYSKLLESVNVKKITLPPFMSKLDEMIGSIDLGSIGVLAAGTGAGKTSFTNELVYHWLFNSPYKIGIVSLELTCGQYAQALLSRHVAQKIAKIRDPDEKLKFLSQQNVIDKADELFKDSEGNDRFVVIDERDGSVEVLQEKIEEMIISCECKVIIADPISDIFDSLTIDQQALFMKWQKSMVKNYNVTFINIAHIRKGSSNKEAASSGSFVPEEAITGSSTLIKSASWVVMLQRDKYAEDEIVRNTTHVTLTKNRSQGTTGKAGSIYYCSQTHTLHDLDDYLSKNPRNDF